MVRLWQSLLLSPLLCLVWTGFLNELSQGKVEHHDVNIAGLDESVYFPFDLRTETPSLCEAFRCDFNVSRFNSSAAAKSWYLLHRKPAVLTGEQTASAHWPALRWNLWHWARHTLPVLRDVLRFEKQRDSQQGENVFLIRNDDGGALHEGEINDVNELSSFPAYQVESELLLWDFLYDVNSSLTENSRRNTAKDGKISPPLCRFISRDYDELEAVMKLENDTTWEDFRIFEDLGLPAGEAEGLRVSPLLNLLYPGCALQTRRSEYHTVKVQIIGTARYYLVSPSKILGLHPFSAASSAASQSQINLRAVAAMRDQLEQRPDVSDTVRALLASDDLLQYVELSPGEALFIPPGYSVLTEATALSLSLDVLSPSREQVLYMEALLMPLPFQRHADLRAKNKNAQPLSFDEEVIFTQVFLAHLISRIEGVTTIGGYVRNLCKSRYDVLFPMESLQMQSLLIKFSCYQSDARKHENIVKSMDPERVETAAQLVANRFNDELLLKSGAKWLLLGDYIDQLVRDIAKNHSLSWIPLFLHTCLDISSKVEVVEEVEGPSVVELDPIY